MAKANPNTKKKRTWCHKTFDGCEIDVFLVEAPHSFGHSQLILKSSSDMSEDEMFGKASIVVKECLPVMRKQLPKAVSCETWGKLREYTKTSGKYIKTLVLKASANENENEYKIHLIPYFESHLCVTTALFQKDRDIDKNKKGGLFRWLGVEERRLEDQIELWRDTCHFPTALIDSFELIRLAKYLKKYVPKGKPKKV
jgi:hypothetical protein